MKLRLYVLKNIKRYLFPIKWSIAALVVLSLISLPVNLLSPKFFQILVDEVMYQKNSVLFWAVVLGMLAVFILKLVIDRFSLKLNNRIHNRFVYQLRKDVFEKYEKAPISFIEKKEIGELKMRLIDDINVLGNFVGDQIVGYIYGIALLVLTVIASVRISWQMTLLCIFVLPIVFIVDSLIGNGTRRINEEIRDVNSKYYTSTHNSLQFWREIKAQGSEQLFIERFQGFRDVLARLGLKSIRFWAYREVFSDFKSNYLTRVLVYIIGAFFVAKNQISVGTLIMFSEYFSMLFSSLESLNAKRVSLKVNAPYYERVFDTFSFPEESTSAIDLKAIEKGIYFRNASFSYSKTTPVLKDIRLQINKGDYVAIVGKTGCGKTTLAKLLLGLCDVTDGEILLDDIDIKRISRKALSNLLGVVMQDNYLFNLSIRENLLISNEAATETEMMEACKKANIYEFISEQPKGLDTVIGERGIKLSGGQKQRISIAAALLRKPQVLIFDEATSALDRQSEDIINDAINRVAEDITVIVIAHKPETVLRAKKVVVIEEGRIVAQGSHEELINNNGFYKNIVEETYNEERKQIDS